MNLPKIPAETSPFLWGASAGALALAIVGFTWGGWVSSSGAERMASMRADAATLAVLTPICVSQFRTSPKAKASLAALKEVKSWEQADYVRNGGWATMPGKAEPSREVAAACAEALTAQ
ncbi:MAG TPA: hypothetical protein VJQ51_09660 [Burkholderiales bacterium]|nr:hypothetical protein [Burkholderiales bacterium]